MNADTSLRDQHGPICYTSFNWADGVAYWHFADGFVAPAADAVQTYLSAFAATSASPADFPATVHHTNR